MIVVYKIEVMYYSLRTFLENGILQPIDNTQFILLFKKSALSPKYNPGRLPNSNL